jgi:hypothetical protein
VGKDLAAKIIERDIAPGANSIFSGLDLKVGGQGMRKFYDEMLVKEFGKYVKHLGGGTVEASEVNSSAKEYKDPVFDIPQSEQDRILAEAHAAIDREHPDLENDSDDYMYFVQERVTDLSNEWAQKHGVKPTTTPIHLIRITPQMRSAVEAGQALFVAPRRARESMTFDPPFHTAFGDILSYDWKNQSVGGMASQRISDWSAARTNPVTGREIVHHFKVRKPDGIHTVSLETALGQLSKDQRSKLQGLIKAEQERRADAANGQMALFSAHRQFAPAIRFEGRVSTAPGGMHYDALVEQIRRSKLPAWQREQDDSRRLAIRWIRENPNAIEKDYTEGFMTPEGFKNRDEALTLARQMGFKGGNDAYGLTSADIQVPSQQSEMGMLASSDRVTNPSQIEALRAIFPHANDPSKWIHPHDSRPSQGDLQKRQSLAHQFGGGTASRPNRAFTEDRIAGDQTSQRRALTALSQGPQRADQYGSKLDACGEHFVYISDDGRHVTKITLPGFYGYVPTEDVAPGITGDFRRIKLRFATPAEYLLRLALFSELTGINWEPHGMELNEESIDAPVIVSTQPFIPTAVGPDGKPVPVTEPQITAYMDAIGFEPVEETTGTVFRDKRMENQLYWHPEEQTPSHPVPAPRPRPTRPGPLKSNFLSEIGPGHKARKRTPQEIFQRAGRGKCRTRWQRVS